MGRALEWDRGEDKKSSKICVSMEGVSLTKTEDWDKIKDFMVSNAKAMHENITKCLEGYRV